MQLTRLSAVKIAILISLLPFIYLFTQANVLANDYVYTFGNIAGLIGATLMLWQFALGIRYISRKISPDYVSLIKLHMSLGIYGTFFVFIHPILEMSIYQQGVAFLYSLGISDNFELYASAGRIAFFLFILIWITSAIARDKISRRPWLYIHYLTYPMLALVFLHAYQIGSFILEFPLIRAYWLLLAFTFFLMLAWRVSQVFNLGKARYILTSKHTQEDGITLYHFKPQGKHLAPQVGQFFYIKPKFFAEAHPFTIMTFDQKTGELTFGIKAVGPFTNQLENIHKNQTVYLDGPYGVFTQEGHNKDPKVIFAGGIGITPFVELVSRFGGANTYLFYSNKKLQDAVNRDQFIKELGENYYDVISREQVQDNTIIQGRIDADKIKAAIDKKILTKAKFFICGSPRYMAGITTSLTSLGVPKSRIFTEEFSL